MGFIAGMQGWFNSQNSLNVIHHISKGQKPNAHPNWCTKSIWQNPTPMHDKNSQQIGNRREFPQPVKLSVRKLIANMVVVKDRSFFQRSGTNDRCLLLLLLFNNKPEVLVHVVMQEKDTKCIQFGKEVLEFFIHRSYNPVCGKS